MRQLMLIAQKNLIKSKSFKYKASITRSTYNATATARGYDADKEG